MGALPLWLLEKIIWNLTRFYLIYGSIFPWVFVLSVKSESVRNYDRIRYIIDKINYSRGTTDIESLASDTFLSRKQFERTFSSIIGATPKQFCGWYVFRMPSTKNQKILV